MGMRDEELVLYLWERDGPLRPRSFSHRATGVCRYTALYPKGDCPWCAAINRREAREAAALPKPDAR